ncbi:type I polyketide synthase, partial [bacterium]
GVAIIGMAGRFPGAKDIDTLWENLCNGVESITVFNRDELGPGIDEALRNDPDYIPARGIIEDADKFDAAFFGIGPQEAKVMDPQQRIFLELAWAALENAGYCTDHYNGLIGVYAGVGDNHYYPINLLGHTNLLKMVGQLIVGYGNEKDYIATRVSYALNLTGPSVSANTGCSTSLLAVDNAVRALINFECDMALAGGVDIGIPQKSGFLYQTGGVFSKDGHCRPFDSEATGTLFNDGAGIVILKRLSDALKDGDQIWAVVRGSAKNNDGANKVSFLAPSVEGQAQVIAMAQAQANILPEDISYIEAHGTGTPMGDPIEIEALTKVFRYFTEKNQFCYLGSIKGNIGHPTIASGVAGLIKTVLCLYHEKIPATLHYKKPNPKIDFKSSPFKVVDQLTPWPRNDRPRLAGISSFGFGGTNVHAIVEEAPVETPSGISRPQQLLLFSAKTQSALEGISDNFKQQLNANPNINLADIAYTLQLGRQSFIHRRFVICDSIVTAKNNIDQSNPLYTGNNLCEVRDPDIVFMFPGQGSQYIHMGKNLYEHEPLFRDSVNSCCEILQPMLGCDLRDIIYPDNRDKDTAYNALKNTFYTQPAIFTIEYALAVLWMSWGIQPKSMIGHSIGEFVCACISGVMSLEDALKLVALRGRLMRDLPKGSMLTVRLSAEEIEARLPEAVQLAAANSPKLCVVSGPTHDIELFQKELEKDDIPCKHLHTSHAFHSAMMDPIVEPFTEEVKKYKLSVPKIPFVSTVTTTWITNEQATDPAYWGTHLRMPVKFSHGIREMIQQGSRVFLEVGPRTTLTTLTRQHMTGEIRLPVIASIPDTSLDDTEWKALLAAIGNLWLQGVTFDWNAFYKNENRHRIPLPSYPFERKRYWVDPLPRSTEVESISPPPIEHDETIPVK